LGIKRKISFVTMEEIKIIRVTSTDIGQLQEISKQTFFDTFAPYNSEQNMQQYLEENLSLRKLSAELNTAGSEFYFAWLDQKVIGYLKINAAASQTEIRDEKALEIERIYVLQEFHGQRVGQILYEKAIGLAQERGLHYIWLGVWEKNARALRFYEKNGFEPFDRHIFKLGEDEQTDIMVKKVLK